MAPTIEEVRALGVARFAALHAQLDPLLDKLLACPPHSRQRVAGQPRLVVPATAGVYLFTATEVHQYVGRAKNLNRRLGLHTRPSSRQNQASFAFNQAKRDADAAGFPTAGATRDELDRDPEFNERFFAPAKAAVRAMEFRFVQFATDMPDVDAISTTFEVYASMCLGTEGDFNLFATH